MQPVSVQMFFVGAYWLLLVADNLKRMLVIFPLLYKIDLPTVWHIQVQEETGFDVSKLLNKDEYIEKIFGQQRVRLYIIAGVRDDTAFAPQTKKEISVCFPFVDKHTFLEFHTWKKLPLFLESGTLI